ncbi:MAG: trigger factor [Lentisphaerae bacterium GWF2_45_14]|nr:MAG: trigger factor [Lentisphaerae bacterium GWF2_45_14]
MSKKDIDLKELRAVIQTQSAETEPCRKKVDFKIPSDMVKHELENVIEDFKDYAQIPGFRKGKAPASIIKNRYMPQIKEELTKKFYTAGFEKVVEDEKLDVVTYSIPNEEKTPEINFDGDFSFTINFETAPQFEISEYKGVKVDAPSTEIGDAELSEKIDYFKNLYAEYKSVEAIAEKGDMLKVSYKSDFEMPEDASPSLKRQLETDEGWVWLSEPEAMPGVIEALAGAEKDKEYKFESQYPEKFREEALGGKKVNYTVKVLDVQRRTPLESEEDLCKKMQVDNMDALKERLTKSLVLEKEKTNKKAVAQAVFEKINAAIPDFPIPPSALSEQIEKELRAIASKEVKTEEDAEKFKQEKENYLKEAEKSAKTRLRRFFIMRKIAQAEDIKVEDNELDQHLKYMSGYYGINEKNLRQVMMKTGGFQDMQMDILDAKVSEFIADSASAENK